MKNETQKLKWWEEVLIWIIMFTIFSIISSIGLSVFIGHSERVELRKLSITQANLNILKTKYEIMKLSCNSRGGRFIESNWSVECN